MGQCHYNRGPRELPGPFHQRGHREKPLAMNHEEGPHWCFDLRLPSFQKYEKQICFVIGSPISGICYSSLDGLRQQILVIGHRIHSSLAHGWFQDQSEYPTIQLSREMKLLLSLIIGSSRSDKIMLLYVLHLFSVVLYPFLELTSG